MVMCSQGTGQNRKGVDLLLQYRLKAADAPILRLLDGIIVQGLEEGPATSIWNRERNVTGSGTGLTACCSRRKVLRWNAIRR